MKVHYFYSRQFKGNFFDVKLEAIMEEDVTYAGSNEPGKSFLYLEIVDIMLHQKPEQFQTVKFKIDFGKNSSHGPGYRTVKEMLESKAKDNFEEWHKITRAQYERLRKMIFAAYAKQQCMDFDLVAEPQKNKIRIL